MLLISVRTFIHSNPILSDKTTASTMVSKEKERKGERAKRRKSKKEKEQKGERAKRRKSKKEKEQKGERVKRKKAEIGKQGKVQ